jgi:hypothetical protein
MEGIFELRGRWRERFSFEKNHRGGAKTRGVILSKIQKAGTI